MENSQKYFYQDFTEEHYAELLVMAKSKYKFVNYDEFSFSSGEILWRHDVDASFNRAYRMAVIENQLGIKSIYFINIHCEFDNVFEKSQFELVEKIISLGHTIGLHFDFSFYKINSKNDLEKYLLMEKNILESFFNTDIKAFSFHNPDKDSEQFDEFIYAGLINTYAKKIKEEIFYCSDSNGYWRFNRLSDVLKGDKKNLHILTHPANWQKEAMSPSKRMERCIEGRAKKIKSWYKKLLENNGRLLIDE